MFNVFFLWIFGCIFIQQQSYPDKNMMISSDVKTGSWLIISFNKYNVCVLLIIIDGVFISRIILSLNNSWCGFAF